MLVTLKPAALSERTADSRPGPGPLMRTSRFFTPCSAVAVAARSAATCAADGGPALARGLEAAGAGGRPGQGIALAVGYDDDGVVERGVNVGDGVADVLL